MAWLRVLLLMVMTVGTASARRRPPPNPDLTEMNAPHMRPPPPDETELLRRRVTMALARATTTVQACAARVRRVGEFVDVRVTIGSDAPLIRVPQVYSWRFPQCVKLAVDDSMRAMFGGQLRSRRVVEVSYRYTLRARGQGDGYAQPPP